MSIPAGSYCEFYEMNCEEAWPKCAKEGADEEDFDPNEDCEYCGRCIEPEYEP